jgi:hypothetical protein
MPGQRSRPSASSAGPAPPPATRTWQRYAPAPKPAPPAPALAIAPRRRIQTRPGRGHDHDGEREVPIDSGHSRGHEYDSRPPAPATVLAETPSGTAISPPGSPTATADHLRRSPRPRHQPGPPARERSAQERDPPAAQARDPAIVLGPGTGRRPAPGSGRLTPSASRPPEGPGGSPRGRDSARPSQPSWRRGRGRPRPEVDPRSSRHKGEKTAADGPAPKCGTANSATAKEPDGCLAPQCPGDLAASVTTS